MLGERVGVFGVLYLIARDHLISAGFNGDDCNDYNDRRHRRRNISGTNNSRGAERISRDIRARELVPIPTKIIPPLLEIASNATCNFDP